MPPSQAGPRSKEDHSPQGHQPSSWALQSAKGRKHSSRSNTSPTAPLLRKATQAVFQPRTPHAFGQSGAGLPLAPWALLLCRGSPEPESHSQCVLLRGEAGLGVRRPSAPRPQQCHPSQAGPDSPKPRLPNGTNRAPGGCSLKGDRKRPSGAHTSPNGPKLRKATKAVFAPSPPLAVRQRGAGLPLAP